jgi:hypothetical protein
MTPAVWMLVECGRIERQGVRELTNVRRTPICPRYLELSYAIRIRLNLGWAT